MKRIVLEIIYRINCKILQDIDINLFIFGKLKDRV